MNKVSFFRSIHLKFVLVYVLLILIAMQIIGVYFVRQLEDTLVTNFKTSIYEKSNLLVYTLEEEFRHERDDESPTIEEDVYKVLSDFKTEDIIEMIVVDDRSKIIGSSIPNNQDLVGQRTNDILVKRSLASGKDFDRIYIDESNSQRQFVISSPILLNGDIVGSVLLKSRIETVFQQMKVVIKIFATGILIAVFITAILGVLLAQTITRPISDMRKQAIALSMGNFSRKVKVYGNDEIGQLVTTFNTLTRRLEEAQATKENERRKLSSVLSYMTDGVIATDRNGRVILINKPAERMLQVTGDDVMLTPITELLKLTDDYTFTDLLNEQDSVILDYSSDRASYILRANFSTIKKETGVANGLIAVLHDITEQQKIETERREFVANVSHELRTPLTTMRSYLEALADGAWEDEDIAPQFIGVTQTETERMIRLVNDLLKLSRMDSKDYTLTKTPIDFVEFFNLVIDRFEFSLEPSIKFVRKIPNRRIYVNFDEDKITQVIDNIISNAIKYSPEGGKITFQLIERGHGIIVHIRDEGVGFPKDEIDKVFDRFYRVDKARTRKLGGTGLGLAIAREMIEAHNGEIWASSQERKGTKVSFTLPYSRGKEGDFNE